MCVCVWEPACILDAIVYNTARDGGGDSCGGGSGCFSQNVIRTKWQLTVVLWIHRNFYTHARNTYRTRSRAVQRMNAWVNSYLISRIAHIPLKHVVYVCNVQSPFLNMQKWKINSSIFLMMSKLTYVYTCKTFFFYEDLIKFINIYEFKCYCVLLKAEKFCFHHYHRMTSISVKLVPN